MSVGVLEGQVIVIHPLWFWCATYPLSYGSTGAHGTLHGVN